MWKKIVENGIGVQVNTGRFRKGLPPWNKGKKCPQLSRENNPFFGRKHTEETGERHHFWKGGITSINEKIRKSFSYLFWRRNVFERDNYTCQECGQRGGELHADHIKPFALFPNLRFDLGNGRTLCVPCHRNTKTYGCKLKSLALAK